MCYRSRNVLGGYSVVSQINWNAAYLDNNQRGKLFSVHISYYQEYAYPGFTEDIALNFQLS